ncbi:MAG: AbrB/MazE/SpoVT family DNA-binding domain-containing protein [Thermoleophilaceae bacterium]|nr:AbrB/MazE/SpoVT family DNA-binding domain-containing protein [Thermoleophilaceae bacterium]
MTTTKVGPKGQVVIPKAVRDQLAIRPGDEVVVEAVDGEARVRRLPAGEALLGLLEDGAGTADIEAEHRRELEREERKIAYWDERERARRS